MTDFYSPVFNDLSDYTCDQTIISKQKYLKYISRVLYEENEVALPEIHDWYPLTNSYYPYTEDVDAVARVNHLLGSKPSFESLTSIPNCEDFYSKDSYSERGAQLQYLSANPVSFLILGKPGIGEQELGKILAEHWKCVYIDPETLIREEINSETRAGQCIEFNLRCGRAIGVDVITRLVEKRVKSQSAQHRGFVICGFPLIPNDLYTEDPISSESAVFTAKEIFEDVLDTTVEIGVPPEIIRVTNVLKPEDDVGEEAGEEEAASDIAPSGKSAKSAPQDDIPLDIGSDTERNICSPGELEKNFEEQIDFIFSLFQRPFIVIYIMCSNSDVVSKHKDYRFDFFTKQVVDLQREYSDKLVYTYFSTVPGTVKDDIPDDFIDIVKNTTMRYDTSSPRQLVRLPKDFPCNLVTLLDHYRYSALPVIERHILMHDCQYLMKVDGRISPVRMFSAVKTRLRVLPLQKVVLPQKLLVPEQAGEGPAAEDADMETLPTEENFERLRRKQIASPMFKWSWSDWGIKCPVSMKEGGYEDGDPKYGVHFMNKMFFLSNEDAYVKFYRNPRPYLLPPYPKPSCRIIIIGPRCSGKTAVAKCIAYLLMGEVLEYDKLYEDFLNLKRKEYEDDLRKVAINDGILELNEQRRNEMARKKEEDERRLDEWIAHKVYLLQETIKFKWDIADEEEENVSLVVDLSPYPVTVTYNKKSNVVKYDGSDTSLASAEVARFKETMAELEQLISISGVPSMNDIALCKELLSNRERLLSYLPSHLRLADSYDIEPATIFDVKEYVENTLSRATFSEIKLTTEHILETLRGNIKDVEERSEAQGNNKGGWILDGLPPKEDIVEKLFLEFIPEDIFVLKDTESHDFLLERFETRGLNEFRDYRNFFIKIGKPDIAWRSPSLRSTDSYKSRVATDFIGDILDATYATAEEKADTGEKDKEEEHEYFKKHPRRAAVQAYEKELHQFDEEWDNLYAMISEYKHITVTEMLVTNKSLDELLEEVVKNIEDRFKQVANIFTADDRTRELEDFGEPDLQGELGEGEEKGETEDIFFQNRRFGDTFNYCPVTFHDHWVLWQGKEEFAAEFQSKLYLMCSENAMDNFAKDPRHYLPLSGPPKIFPPPRICIVGPDSSGKTTVAKTLRRNLGLYCIDYDVLLQKQIAPKSTFKLREILEMGIAGEKGEVIQNYLTFGEPLPEEFINPLILPLWFEDPIRTFGFVLDGFPKRPSDVEFMVKYSAIPDIVVELTITEEDIHRRFMEKFMEDWQKSLDEKRDILEKRHGEIINVWEERRDARFKELMDIKKEERYKARILEKEESTDEKESKPSRPYLEDLAEADEETDVSTDRTKSMVSYDSVAEEADAEVVNKILAEELPEPVFEELEPEENVEELAEVYINSALEAYAIEVDYLRTVRENCEMELIPWITVDAGMSHEKVFAQVMRVVDKCNFRNESLFERVYDISVDLADRLLSSGYYFLSKFGKTCPVQIYEDINPVQMFLPLEEKFQLYPVIHRQYIYFLAGHENREKFKERPLKYTSNKIYNFPLIPLKLAVIGPPKSGKTALAERFKRDLGLNVISRGQAGRHVLKYLEFSDLARNMETVLRVGWNLTNEMAMKCVEAVAFNGKCLAQGYVLDGFPNDIEEVRHLAQLGLVPNLVIDLQADETNIYEFLAGDVGKRGLPVFPRKLIEHRYEEWSKTADEFKGWLDKEYQIIAKVPVPPSKWCVWTAAHELATAVFSEIKHYYKYAFCDVALRLANMQITPLEFNERQGTFKNYCPCCLHYSNTLVSGGDPPDRTGVVQFRRYYYYLCHEHIDTFINNPEQFLAPYNNNALPSDLPLRIVISKVPKNVYEEGTCIVCYWLNQPSRLVKEGDLHYAVLYREKVYLFDCLCCMNTFMKEPHTFFAKLVTFKGKPYRSMKYRELPTLGLLQQYDANQLVKAIVNTGILRPVIPGLSPAVSAALSIGLYLKTHNPKTPRNFLPLYEEAQKRYHGNRLNLIHYLAQMKKMINPYLYYDEPLPKFVDPLFPDEKQVQEPESESHMLAGSEESSDTMVYQNLLDSMRYTYEDDVLNE